ncbi:hypothetical protein [Photorhabdus khanii]|uniref:Uncharacterized protein n=1 Tax=Photorhabdus khanii subsp. guanajuatensis TaxID=2100166 RepID=A0A4V6P8G6_9GAMM|nr:hypothetical protein [Photorhabdus khanii]TDB58605.1 hypothetical protein C5467_09860 [Photorhabdus khanii subsp. guanajuatensis]
MTIISTKFQLMPFFSNAFLEKTARRCDFMEQLRNIGPQSLVLRLIAALSKGNWTGATITDTGGQKTLGD